MDDHSKPQPWNPKLILCQIMAMQCFYYLALGLALGFSHILFGTTLSLEHFFTARHMNPASAAGWIGIACTVFAALAGWAAPMVAALGLGANRAHEQQQAHAHQDLSGRRRGRRCNENGIK